MRRTPRRHEGTKQTWLRVLVSSWQIGLMSGVAVLAAQQASPDGSTPQITIVSPENNSFVSGPTLLRVRIDPPEAATAVTFFADGRQVCAVVHQPFECEWDAGATIAEHQVRAV